MPVCKRKVNGKTQYRSAYRWVDDKGKSHQTTTSWFSLKSEADREARRLSRQKSIVENRPTKKNKKAGDVFEEFIDSVQKEVDNGELENKSSSISLLNRLQSIDKKYYSDDLKNTIVKDIEPSYFRRWLESINKKKLSGQTVRSFKSAIQKFNKYLGDRGYYPDYNTDLEVSVAIGMVNLKPIKAGSRKNRRVPTIEDIEELRRYYENDLGKFRNFYYYTFFYFEFYTGMRVSETVALQWKNVDLSPERRVIYVRNAINEKEKRSTAKQRTNIGNYSTKNETSERGVVIFDMIYQLLLDYKYRYKVHYHLSESQIQDCFVFPAIRNPHNYQSHRHLLEELKRACIGAGIEELDNGMFRHGCATFLVAPAPEGLGYSPDQVYSQLGHCDASMINEIYGKLQKEQMTRKNRTTFNRIYHPEEDVKEQEHIEELKYIIHRIEGNNRAAEEFGKIYRFSEEIKRVNASKRKVYYYRPEDEYLIDLMNFKEQYPDVRFVAKDQKE